MGPETTAGAIAQALAERANALWKKQLTEFTPPPLDPGTEAALTDFVDRRKAAMANTCIWCACCAAACAAVTDPFLGVRANLNRVEPQIL